MREYLPSDYETICRWCEARGKSAPPEWSIPNCGLISPGVAVGFLITMSNQCGLMDFYISNPDAEHAARSKDFREITHALFAIAKSKGIKRVLCDTQSNSIRHLARDTGFIELGQFTAYIKEL